MTRAHLVGSVGLRDAETVLTTVSEILGSCCARIPDGETGERGYWIRWQRDTFARHPDFEPAVTTRSLPGFRDELERTLFKLKDRADPTKIEFGAIGYAREAMESYQIFARLADEGKVAPKTRFQVALPTPMALLCGFVVPDDRLKIEPALEVAIIAELELIQRSIPGNRLSIQWDVCFEVVGAEGGPALPYGDAVGGSAERIGRLCANVEDAVELGIHLCYGDPGHKHIVEPSDLGISVAFANGIARSSSAAPRLRSYARTTQPDRRGLFRSAGKPRPADRHPTHSRSCALHGRRRRLARANGGRRTLCDGLRRRD